MIFDKIDGFKIVNFPIKNNQVVVTCSPGSYQIVLLKRLSNKKSTFHYKAAMKVEAPVAPGMGFGHQVQ